MNRLAGELCHDCNGRKLNRGDLACFTGYDRDYAAWNVVAEDSSGKSVYFNASDYWIFLDNPWEGRVDILHPVHGVLNVPISSRGIRLVSTALEKDNNE